MEKHGWVLGHLDQLLLNVDLALVPIALCGMEKDGRVLRHLNQLLLNVDLRPACLAAVVKPACLAKVVKL